MPLLREIQYFLVAVILCAACYSQSASANNNAQIFGLSITHPGNMTRFVFDINQSVRYYYKYSSKPAQLMLEVKQATLACALPKSALAGSVVKDYQGVTQDNATRFSFDLKYPLKPNIYILPPSGEHGYRLVVDLKSAVGFAMISPDKVKKTPNHQATIAKPKLNSATPTPVAVSTSTATADKASTPDPTATALTLTKPSAKHPIVVVIDPGHGGKDPGAIGMTGVKEKMVVLSISKMVQQLLTADPHYRAYLTRKTDIYIPLRQRLAIARGYKPDLFIAIHADAAYKNSAVGASVFALSERGATSELARWLAQKENASELVDGVFVQKDKVLRSVLLDLSQSHAITVSLEIGQTILRQLSSVSHLHYARVEQAAFVVLKSPDIPSLLVETGYLTNSAQERQLSNSAYQKRIAMAIVQGIKNHYSRYPG